MNSTGRFALAPTLVATLLVAASSTMTFAGGPLYTYDATNRIPYAWNLASWPNGKVPVYTDLGDLGVVTNARANQMVTFATNQWSSVPTSAFRNAVVGDFTLLGLGDIDASNITSIIGTWTGGGLRMVYDNDGSIMTNYFGLPPTGVLGITNIDFVSPDSPEILQAWMVLSGPGIHANDPNGIGFQGVVTHEMGHALNLAHTQTNGANWNPSVLDVPEPAGCASPWSWAPDAVPGASQVETMYPISDPSPGNTGEYMGTVDLIDDRSALSDIYPAPGYPGNKGTIRGQILDASGIPVTGVNVIARNVADPFGDCSSYISGQVSKGQAGPDGSFVLNDLTPGARYLIYTDKLEVGAFAVPTVLVLPGPEEYFNGAMESGDSASDDRCDWVTVEAQPGSPATADITFNRYNGAPILMTAPATCAPSDITPDGSIVVGGFYGPTPPIFRWDLNTGAFDNIGGFMWGTVGISDDGTKIASSAVDPADGTVKAAIYQNGAWSLLPPAPGTTPCTQDGYTTYNAGFDISGDGSTVVGLSYGDGCFRGGIRAFKWTAAGGSVVLPKYSSFNYMTRANAVNYDGSVIVGLDEATSGFWRGAYWKNGAVKLITRNGQNVQSALDVSRDGQYIVGQSSVASSNDPWRYSVSANTVELLGQFPNFDAGVSNAISDDHGVITGFSTSSTLGYLSPAIWTPGLHWSDFNSFLLAQGINLQGVAMYGASAMSADGHVLTGALATQFGSVGFALKTPTSIVCHAAAGSPTQTQTTIVSFPHGLDTALAGGDTLGPCQCNTTAPTGIPQLIAGKPAAGTARVEWNAVPAATGYDLVRGSLSALRRRAQGGFSTATTDCLENDLTATSRDEADVPTTGDGFWYLVRAVNCGGSGTFDSGAPSQIRSRDAGINASPSACP